jgi:hypoxanthine phosphoribosyltransferase
MPTLGQPRSFGSADVPTDYSSFRELGDVLVSEEKLRETVAALGARIGADYAGKSPLLVCVLKGAFVFMADLSRAIPVSVEVDFMAVSTSLDDT